MTMRRRRPRYASGPPAPGGKPPTEPLPIIDLHPTPLPQPGPPPTRESTLADLQTGFASLTEDELALARLWLVGEDLDDVCYMFRMSEKKVRALWRSMRGKVRFALLDESERAAEAPDPAPAPPSTTDSPREPGGASPR
jgi:hypothetical protein